jgi:hypothetical protein
MWSLLPLVQGVYYIVTGIWPIVSIESFEAISGPKNDDWLVQTMGLLIFVIGAILLGSGVRRKLTLNIGLLAAGSAAALGGAGSFFALRGVIWPIYLVDGFIELVLIALWIAAGLHLADGRRAT